MLIAVSILYSSRPSNTYVILRQDDLHSSNLVVDLPNQFLLFEFLFRLSNWLVAATVFFVPVIVIASEAFQFGLSSGRRPAASPQGLSLSLFSDVPASWHRGAGGNTTLSV